MLAYTVIHMRKFESQRMGLCIRYNNAVYVGSVLYSHVENKFRDLIISVRRDVRAHSIAYSSGTSYVTLACCVIRIVQSLVECSV